MQFITKLLYAPLLFILICTHAIPSDNKNINYATRSDVKAFIDNMVKQHGFEEKQLVKWFSQVKYKQSIIDAISKPAEKKFTWARYRNIFIKDNRISGGVKFWNKNQKVLSEMEQQFGVPAEIIVSIIGVETFYGKIKGSYRVMDALSTLGFDYPQRAKFFAKELENFLLLAREQNQSPLSLTGSYAGAMGYGQFIPSSYRNFSVDYDGDKFADIWNNESDAIWSVANYFSKHHWKIGGNVTFKISPSDIAPEFVDTTLKPKRTVRQLQTQLGQPLVFNTSMTEDDKVTLMALKAESETEYWIGLHNFYVITRYNRSKLYAMAVFQLAEAIKTLKNK